MSLSHDASTVDPPPATAPHAPCPDWYSSLPASLPPTSHHGCLDNQQIGLGTLTHKDPAGPRGRGRDLMFAEGLA